MRVHHIIIADTEADAFDLRMALASLDVSDVKQYGTTVQIAIPGHITEHQHWKALRSLANGVIPGGFKMGRASGD